MPRRKNSVIDEERPIYEKTVSDSEVHAHVHSKVKRKKDSKECEYCVERNRRNIELEEERNPFSEDARYSDDTDSHYSYDRDEHYSGRDSRDFDERGCRKPYSTKNKNSYMKANWKTSLCGLSLVIFAIVGRVMDFINGGEAIGMGIAGIGLILGKDYDIISRR